MAVHPPPQASRALCALVTAMLVPVAAACSQGEDLADSSFCDEVRSRADAFVAQGAKEVPPTLIGALRAVVADGDAPDELRDAYSSLTEAPGDEAVDDALADVEEVIGRCGVVMDE